MYYFLKDSKTEFLIICKITMNFENDFKTPEKVQLNWNLHLDFQDNPSKEPVVI